MSIYIIMITKVISLSNVELLPFSQWLRAIVKDKNRGEGKSIVICPYFITKEMSF